MTEDYKISLGVKLDTSDIRKQINDASGDIKPIELKIDAETKELTKTIKEALNSLSKGAKNAFTLDTSNIQTSLDNLSKTIVDIRNSLGTLDGKGMKDLVSSINQMATALGKAENESDSLVKSLSVLSKKDFSVNIGLDMGKKNTSMIAYGRAARKQVIPELEAQIKYLENLFGGKQATVNKLARQGKNVGFDIFTDFGDFNSDSAIKKMESMEKYIASLKKLATIDNVNLDGFNEIHKDASALINDITGVENAVNKASGVPEKLKNLFGSGISSEQLDSIVLDLKEIKNAIVDLSKGVSFEGLTQSFDRLSNSIENLLANAEKVKGVLNSNLGNSAIDGTSTVDTAPIKSAQQTGKEIGDAITKSAQQSINLDDVIDEQVSSIMQKYAIVGDKGSKAFEEIKQAVLECRRELGILENGNFSIDEEVFGSSRAVDKVTDAIANQMRAVNNLGDEYVKLADYITDFNNSAKGYKVHIPDAVKQEQGDDYRSNRGVLGNAFTTGKGNDFADFITGLNQDLGQTIDLTKGEAEAFDELLRKVELGRKQREALKKSDKYLTSNASTDEILSQNYINKNEIYDDTISAVDAINAAEREAAQTSIQTTNIVVQNEEKKQQAYKETANAYDAISKDTSLVRDDVDFQKIFESSNQAAQEAQRHFQALLADEKAVVSVTEQFDDNNALQSFVVNIKRASGEVETLRYAMNKLDDVENFAYQGGSASDSKVEKQLETRIKKANDLQIKLDKIKSGYSDMGAAKPIKDINHIEILDEQYRKVEKAIVDVRNADDTTFSSMISNAEKERTALENMVREFRNAENVATSLRSKDIDTVKGTYGSKLDVLISKMKSSGVYTSGFESGADNLRSVLSSATDASGLVKFLNGLDKLEAGYKRADAAVKEFNRSQKVGINVSGLESKIKDVQRISPEIDQFEAEIDGAKVSVKSLLSDLGKVKTQGDFSVVNARFKAFADAAKAASIAVTETVTKVSSVNKIKIKLADTGFNGFEQEIQRVRLEAEKLENVYPELEAALKRLDVAMDGVYSADQAGDVKRLVAANEEYELSLKQVYSQLKLYQQAEKQAYDADILSQKKASLSSEMEIWLKENSRAAKDFGKEIRRLQASLDSLDANGVKLVGQQFKTITKQAQAMGKTGLTMLDKIKSKFAQYAAYFSVAELFMYAEQALRSMFETVKEIDTAMTGLYRVTDLTAAEYDSLFNEMISSAKEYGATLNDIINATTDWVRAGFDANTSLGLAEVTTMYQHISDLDYDTAAENLITAYNGFKDELNGVFNGDTVASVNYIADIFNELDNNFAVTSAGLGEALTRSASALDLAGNSIQETAGMITGIVEVTQDPEKAGSALKVLSLRLRGMKGQLEELGEETDENVENISKMQGQILNMTGGKVNIFDASGDFKSTYEIMQGIAEVWDDLSSIDQANLLETIAGKNRANDVAALLSNWKNVEAAVKSATEAEGSAARENAKYVDSIQGRLDKLTTTWQSFANTFMSSDFLKGAVSALTSFVEGLEKVIDTVGTFPALATIISAGFSLFKNGGIFKTLTSDLDGFITKIGIAKRSFADLTNAFKSGSTSGGLKGGLSAIKNSLSGGLTKADIANIQAYNKEIKNGTSAQTAWYRTMQTSSQSAQDLVASANGGTVALNGMKAATIGSKVALIGAKVAAIAFNAALTMGISLLIDWAISGIQKLVNAKKDLAEAVEEITTKFKEQSSELKKLKGDYNTDNESSMISKYEKLSKGVDNLGRNVSLTSDEYSEYQSIVNTIADQFPQLINGYDSQGNALLKCKDNVEELTKAYEELIEANSDAVLGKAGDIAESFGNAVDDKTYGGKLFQSNKTLLFDDIEILKKSLKDEKVTYEELKNAAADSGIGYIRIKNAIKSAGLDWSKGATYKIADIQSIINGFYSEFESELEGMKSIPEAILDKAFNIRSSDYYGMSEELKSIAEQIVSSFDEDFYLKYADDADGLKEYVSNMLDQLNSFDSEHGAKIESAFDLQTQFNGGEISYGEYVHGLEDVGKTIDKLVSSGKLDKEIGTQIKLSIGLDEEGLVDEYQRLRNRLASEEFFNISEPEYESFIKGLSSEELSVVWDVIPELEETSFKENIEQVKAALKKEMMLKGLTFDLNLEVEAAGIEALNTAMAESVSGAGLSSESIAALKGRYAELEKQGWDLSTMFEETSHGIHLNRREFNKFEKAYASQKLKDVNADLDEMKATYDELGEQLKTCGDEAKAGIYNDRFTLAQKIAEAATLAAQYEGLTSAYNDWLAAEEAGQERDMYENVISGFETIDDEISRGWYDDSTIEFLELLTGKDLSTAGIDEIKKAYKGLDKEIKHTSYSVRDFFTVDDEGNTTADGVYNFLDAIGQMEEEKFGGKDIVKRNKNGKIISFDFELAGGDEAIAEALGISEELVQIMKRAADDAGFVVTLDGSYKQLADLQKEARSAAEYLKSIGKTDFNFDFNTTSVENLNKQLDEAHKILDDPDFWNKDGTFNFNAKGATEAMQIVSTLQAKIDSLTQEQYGIGLTVEDEEFEEPLEKLQNYGRTVATLNQLKLNPEANTEDIEKFEGELEDISKYFAELDKDKKVKLGFDADDNWEEVQKKIESGEVKIPTVLDIQTNMDKNLETLADLALLNSGLLTDGEEETIKKKYKVEVEADEVDTSDVDDKVKGAVEKEDGETKKVEIEVEPEIEVKTPTEKLDSLLGDLEGYSDTEIEVITKFIADPSDVENYTPEQKETIIKFIADTLEVDGYTPEEKKAYAKYLVDGGNLDDYTPEEKEAIVRYLIEGEAVDSYSPEEKQAIVKFLKNSGEVDNYTPAEKQAIAKFIKNSVEPDGYQPPNKEAIATYYKDSSAVDNYQPANKEAKVTFWATIKKVGSSLWGFLTGQGSKRSVVNGTANVDGTAFANGTTGRAYKQGSWGTKNSGTALVGELGREVLVRNGRYYTIGDNGAEFIKYKKGDIIFNHVQSEELFKNGKVTSGGGRARALAQGTAFDTGTGGGEYGGSAVGSNDKDKFEETFDWIDTLLSRLERTIDNLDKTVNNAYKSWSDRNNALASEIVEVGKLINQQNSAYTTYMNKADAVGLSESWASKVRNGSLSIEDEATINESTAEKIKEYQEWYEKALKCKDAIEDLEQTEAELYEQRFENVQSQYDGIVQGFEHTESMLNEYISQAEAKGHIVSKKYYQALIDNEKNNIAELQKEQSDLIAKRDEAVASGSIIKGSQAWYDMCSEIDGVTQAIEEGTTALIEYNNAMRDIDWEVFDLIQERISDVIDETDFLIDLMSYDNLFDDNGKLTDKGMATIGLHGQNYNTYMYQADDYGAKVKDIDDKIASGELDGYSGDVISKRREYVEAQREAILNAEQEKEAIKDLVEDGINLELDALQELIDKKNEELESEKDLYEYQKKVKEQTEEIASLEKQMAAYSGDNSEEARAKVQELKVSLEEAKTNLEETEYDKYLSDTQQMLDALYEEYELILNQRLDNVDALLSDMITEINASATTISSTLSTEATNVGTTLSEAMKSIWENDGAAKSVIAEYGAGFQSKQTTTNLTLDTIKSDVARMVDDVDKDATTKVNSNKTTTSAKKNPTTTSTTKKTTTAKKTSSTGDGKAKIGDKVKFLSGQYYYDSQGKKPLGSHKKGEYVYITNINTRDWATHPYHISTGKKLGSGDLGWLKLNQISGYATGKKNFLDNEIAWTQENGKEFIIRPSDGAILTPIAKGDSVLNAQASGNIWDMANNPAEFIKDSLKLDATNVPNGSSVNNSCVQNFENITFSMPNVRNYEQLVSEMQRDPKFEKLIWAMTLDQVAGKSKLGKNKAIR